MSLYRTVKEDFELHGKRIKKGAVILASLMYAKACDPRVSAGDHADSALPRHMDIGRLDDSFKPERWLDDSNKLDTSVRLFSGMLVGVCDGLGTASINIQLCTATCLYQALECQCKMSFKESFMCDRRWQRLAWACTSAWATRFT